METEIKGRAKGGAKKNANMTPEERKLHSEKMIAAKKELKNMIKASHPGVLKIAGIEIPCYVLENGSRVLSFRGINTAFTGKFGGGVGVRKIPRFLNAKGVNSLISNDLMARILSPIEFNPGVGRSAFGYEATLLPEICEVILDANKAGTLKDVSQAQVAEVLLRGFARVGIIALIDEATGYQRDRERDALAKILEAFVAKELQPYVKAFQPEYYEELFRLRNLPYPPTNPRFRPQYFGVLTNDIVYGRLAPGLLEELKKQAKKDEKKAHLHRRLTQEVGHPKLREHLASVVTVMKLSDDYRDFIWKLNKIHPRYNPQTSLKLEDEDR